MIYVDAIQQYPQCRLPSKDWCHMATDSSLSELHHMAARLGLRRAWFQHKPTHPHYDLTPAKRAASHQARRAGGQHSRTLTALLPGDTWKRITGAYDGGSAMTALKRDKNRSVPDGAQTFMQPHEPMQRDATPHFLHNHSRGNASSAGIVPIDSRVSPSVSQVPTAFPRRFPSFGQAHMLQPFAGPGDRVRIHSVMWASVEVAALQAGMRTAKEVLTWSEAV